MITAVIVDDEKSARTSLTDDISTYCPAVKIIGEADRIKSGMELIIKLNPQLVFLDIHLPDGTGIDLMKRLILKQGGIDKISFRVIFTTADDKQAINAIKFSALDYLLKPVDPDELIVAVNKIKPAEISGSTKVDMQTLLENNIRDDKSKKIVLKSAESISVYPVNEVIRCESQRNYTMFYFKNDKPLLVSTTLGEFDNLLEGYGFIRVHHSHLINLDYLKKFVKADGGYIIMADGAQVPVSQRKKEQLLKLLSTL